MIRIFRCAFGALKLFCGKAKLCCGYITSRFKSSSIFVNWARCVAGSLKLFCGKAKLCCGYITSRFKSSSIFVNWARCVAVFLKLFCGKAKLCCDYITSRFKSSGIFVNWARCVAGSLELFCGKAKLCCGYIRSCFSGPGLLLSLANSVCDCCVSLLRKLRLDWIVNAVKVFVIELHPYFSFSVFVHMLLLSLFFSRASISVFKVAETHMKPVVIDLVAVGDFTNLSVASQVGNKSYSRDVSEAKVREVKRDVPKEGEMRAPVIKNVGRAVKKKPVESRSIQEKGSRDTFETAFKAVKSAGDGAVNLNVSEVERSGVLGVGGVPATKSKPEVISVSDSIRSQIVNCWSVPYGALGIDNTIVNIGIELDDLGSVLSVEVIDLSRYKSDSFFRAVADSAVRAIYKCSPLQGLPRHTHSLWGSIELSFDPREMVR